MRSRLLLAPQLRIVDALNFPTAKCKATTTAGLRTIAN
jgi:hypothetical protein